jgi:hypothetical protein
MYALSTFQQFSDGLMQIPSDCSRTLLPLILRNPNRRRHDELLLYIRVKVTELY